MPSKKKQTPRSTRRKYQSISFPWDLYEFIKAESKERCCSVNSVVNSVMRKQMGTFTKADRTSDKKSQRHTA